jgi:hypothetical protein
MKTGQKKATSGKVLPLDLEAGETVWFQLQ